LPTTTAMSKTTNAQWKTRLPASRTRPFSAASAGLSGSTATRNLLRRRVLRAIATASAGAIGTRRSAYCLNASISRACIGRDRSARQCARERGRRHATSETNSSTVMSANHHEPKTSKNPARRNSSPRNGQRRMNDATSFGEFGICGNQRAPTADASASSIRRISAVRIERRVRQTRATEDRQEDREAALDMGPADDATGPARTPRPEIALRHRYSDGRGTAAAPACTATAPAGTAAAPP
jgi:hypothetical protein